MTQITSIPLETVHSQTALTAENNLLIFSQLFPLISFLNLGSFVPFISLFTILNFSFLCLLFAPSNPANYLPCFPLAAIVQATPG